MTLQRRVNLLLNLAALKNVKELTIKNISLQGVTTLLSNQLQTLTLADIKASGTVDILSGNNLAAINVTGSTFDGLFTVYGNKNLTSLTIDKSTFKKDYYTYSNKSLAKVTISNSTLEDALHVSSNAKGFYLDFIDTALLNTKSTQNANTTGATDDVTVIVVNPTKEKIGDPLFDAPFYFRLYFHF